jgi:hypothetical protein
MTETFNEREREALSRLTLSLVETCIRNTRLEALHAGRTPRSAIGDYSDVVVLTPDGEIPWTELSRISDEEMKALMIECVDRVFTWLTYPDAMVGVATATQGWDRPKLDPELMKRVRRLQADRRIGDTNPDRPA